MLMAAGRRFRDPWLSKVLALAFTVKLASSFIPYAVGNHLYNGVVDAHSYDRQATKLVHLWWHGDFNTHTGQKLIGTGFIVLVTTAIYFIIGPNFVGGFIFFSWLGFWGLYLLYRAFRIALPNYDHRRYAKLIFFLPSLLFWSSNLGKEPWMILSIGFVALGAAKLFAHEHGAFLWLAAGLTGTAMVRPHITVLTLARVRRLPASRRHGARATPLTPIYTTLGILVLIIGGVIVLNQAKSFFRVDSVNSKSVNHVLDTAGVRSLGGGSGFTPTRVHSPTDLPRAALTVLARPFPWEAHNAQALGTSLESVFLMFLFLASWGRVKQLPRVMFREAYVGFAVTYILLFVYAFSAFGNFGLLVRERIQVLPFVFVLLALPKPAPRGSLTVAAMGSRPKVLAR